jgi:hypothetical protein
VPSAIKIGQLARYTSTIEVPQQRGAAGASAVAAEKSTGTAGSERQHIRQQSGHDSVRKGANQCDSDDGERRGQVSIETRAGPSKEGIISPKAAKEMARPPGLEPGTAGLEIYPGVFCQVWPDRVSPRQVAHSKGVTIEARWLGRVAVGVPSGDFMALKWHTS